MAVNETLAPRAKSRPDRRNFGEIAFKRRAGNEKATSVGHCRLVSRKKLSGG